MIVQPGSPWPTYIQNTVAISGAVWNSGTAGNTVQYVNGTTTLPTLTGTAAVLVQLNQTTTITGGAVTFEGTYDGLNWVIVPTDQIVSPTSFQPLTNPYTLVASTQQPFLIILQGYVAVRARLSTTISGSGTVTPFWSTLSAMPNPFITLASGTNVATGSIGATKTAIKASGGIVYGWYFYNSNSTVAYVQFFNLASGSVTLGTTAPTMSLGVPPLSGANLLEESGIGFNAAITIAITTTRAGSTGPTNTVDYNLFYL